jgi:hypothetical protein
MFFPSFHGLILQHGLVSANLPVRGSIANTTHGDKIVSLYISNDSLHKPFVCNT